MSKDEILAVVVLYNQKLTASKAYLSFIAETGIAFFVYDNSPQAMHDAAEFSSLGGVYVHDSKNGGISIAYNAAVSYGLQHGFRWVLLLDQDTDFPSGILQKYIHAAEEHPEIKLFGPKVSVGSKGYISPVRTFGHFSRISRTVPVGLVDLDRYIPINSGLLVDIRAYVEVGGYNEKVKIDFSDYQFIRRFRKNYQRMGVIDQVVFQEFSDLVQTREQKMARFKIYCNSIANCERENLLDAVSYQLLIIKRMLSLMVKENSLEPLFLWIKQLDSKNS